jgi:hypothetical protein
MGDLEGQSFAARNSWVSDSKGKIHRVDPDLGSTLTVSNRDSQCMTQSNCWVQNWKIMGQPCEFQALAPAWRRPSPHGPWSNTSGWTRRSTVRARPGRLSAISVFLCKSVLYGAFVWARRALNIQKRRFPARADKEHDKAERSGLLQARDGDGASAAAAAAGDGSGGRAAPRRQQSPSLMGMARKTGLFLAVTTRAANSRDPRGAPSHPLPGPGHRLRTH